MPCSDSSSSIALKLDFNEKFQAFEYAKITCGRAIEGDTKFVNYCKGLSLKEILNLSYYTILDDLRLENEEESYILYLEWDALRSAIVHYLGIEHDGIDSNRCQITSIEHTPNGSEISLVILPPKEMPKILPCSLK